MAWAAHFLCSPPVGLSALDRLIPGGGGANVARRVQALGHAQPQHIMRELSCEGAAKMGVALGR